MNYVNAKEILPPELFKEIQKYAGGNLLYVPLAEEKEKTWGELMFTPEVRSAKEYNDNGLLEEWIHTYLLFERKHYSFSEGLYEEERFFLGPMAMPLQMFSRNTGPEDGMKWRMHPAVFEDKVSAWQEKIKAQQMLPPIIIGYTDGAFEINCDNPLFEALIREEVTYYPVIMWTTRKSDYDDFVQKYAPYTEFILK